MLPGYLRCRPAPHPGTVSRPSPRLDGGCLGARAGSGPRPCTRSGAGGRARARRGSPSRRPRPRPSRRTCTRPGPARRTEARRADCSAAARPRGRPARGPLTVMPPRTSVVYPASFSPADGVAAAGPAAPARPAPAARESAVPSGTRTVRSTATSDEPHSRNTCTGSPREACVETSGPASDARHPRGRRARSRSAPPWPGCRTRRAARPSRRQERQRHAARRTVHRGVPRGPSPAPSSASDSSVSADASRGSRSVNTAPPSGGVGGGDLAAVDVRVLQRDGQAEAAALGARPGRARLVEAVEDVRQDVLGDAGPVVPHLDAPARRPLAAAPTTRTGEPPCLRALPIRFARMTSRRRGSSRAVDAALGVQVDRVQPGPRVDAGGDLVGDVDVVQDQPGRARVEAGDLHQVLDQVVQPPGLADHQLHGGRDHRVEAGLRLQLLLQHLRDRGDRGQRGAQLVRHVGDEPPATPRPARSCRRPASPARSAALVERP